MKRGGKLPAIPHSASKREKPETDLKKLRCQNCPKVFPQKMKHQRFCSSRCRNQFNNNRSGFGVLKERLPKFIADEVKKAMLNLIVDEVDRVSKESAAIIEIRDRIAKLERSLDFISFVVERKQPDAKPQAG
jgi:protein-arginine kinase activator protein McsA